jgi:hypothetical protein
MAIQYVRNPTTRLFLNATESKYIMDLLWGDQVTLLPNPANGDRIFIKARGKEGFVNPADLGNNPLLELYLRAA